MKELLFIVDIGNSSISFGFFEDEVLLKRCEVASKDAQLDDIRLSLEKFVKDINRQDARFTGGLISSVVPRISRLVQIAVTSVIGIEIPIMDQRYQKLVKIDEKIKDEIGGDILSDIAAASKYYECPALVIDLGTITKFILMDKNATFIATNFFPGVGLCANLMSEKTALLPEIDANSIPDLYMGVDTLSAMNGGLYYGTVHMVEGFAKKLSKEYNLKSVILTGGYSELIHKSLPEYILDKDLVLKGVLTLFRKAKENGF